MYTSGYYQGISIWGCEFEFFQRLSASPFDITELTATPSLRHDLPCHLNNKVRAKVFACTNGCVERDSPKDAVRK